MLHMIPVRSGLRGGLAIRCIFLIGISVSLFCIHIHSAQWDREGARLALEKAQSLQAEISSTQEPFKNQYLSCIKSYSLVYLKDPHFSGSDDAIYESGLLYEKLGNQFGDPDYYAKAVKLLKFLISDYPSSPYCRDARIRLGNLSQFPPVASDAAPKPDLEPKTLDKNSKEVPAPPLNNTNAAVTSNDPAPQSPSIPEVTQTKFPATDGNSTKSSIINSIRYWTKDAYTRVVIDMESAVSYNKARLSNPDRIYFDISNAKLSPDLTSRILDVGDDFVKRIRLGKNRDGVIRIVIDVETANEYSVSELTNPFRIIVDIQGSRASQAKAGHFANESQPKPDEISLESSKGKQENSQKPVIQPQAMAVSKAVAATPALVARESSSSQKQAAKAQPLSADASRSSMISSSDSTTYSNTASAKEDHISKPEDSSQTSAKPTEKPVPETKVTETTAQAAETKSVLSISGREEINSSVSDPGNLSQAHAKTEEKSTSNMASADTVALFSNNKPNVFNKLAETAESTVSRSADNASASAQSASPTPKPASPTSSGDRTLTRILGLKVGRIVLDPGHGGHDTGTVGRGGLKEKELTLEVAKSLRQLLESRLGIDVVLTREEDVFLSLEERTTFANQHRADLFLSIHANSSSLRSTSGVETYFLNFARNASAREIAARENATSFGNVRDLEDFVKQIVQADKSLESKELAAIIQQKLFSGARQLLPSTRNRGVRSAPFVVLIGANMPSVLAEIAFISNPRDESMLKKKENQEQMAKAIYAGIEGYMKTLGSDVAQNRPRTN
jgi:N-acetylmuramoyl-L-alanine amidase